MANKSENEIIAGILEKNLTVIQGLLSRVENLESDVTKLTELTLTLKKYIFIQDKKIDILSYKGII